MRDPTNIIEFPNAEQLAQRRADAVGERMVIVQMPLRVWEAMREASETGTDLARRFGWD